MFLTERKKQIRNKIDETTLANLLYFSSFIFKKKITARQTFRKSYSWREQDNSALDNFHLRQLPPGQFPSEQSPPRKIAPHKGAPGQFPHRIIDPLDRWSLNISLLGLFQLG